MPSALGEGATAARAPGAPPAPALVGANRSAVTLAWAAPSADGGSPVLGYAAELQPKSAAAVEDGMPVDWVLVYQARPCWNVHEHVRMRQAMLCSAVERSMLAN